MLLSAQRVRSPQGLVGVNTYVYRHAAGGWSSGFTTGASPNASRR